MAAGAHPLRLNRDRWKITAIYHAIRGKRSDDDMYIYEFMAWFCFYGA